MDAVHFLKESKWGKKTGENAFCKNKVAKNKETKFNHTDKDTLIVFTTEYGEIFCGRK